MSDHPHIRFKRHWAMDTETSYRLGQCDAFVRATSEIPIRPGDYANLLNVALVKGAQSTTAIEGNTLTDEEIEQVARGEALPPSKEYQEIEVRNILDAMNSILRDVAYEGHGEVITATMLLDFHRRIGRDLGAAFDAIPGRFRTDGRIVGTYRCPDHAAVPNLIEKLCKWLQADFGYDSGRQTFRDAVVEAIVAHVYLAWIHPFGDGNGRTARLIEFFILLRAGLPDITSHILSNHYNMTRSEYYRQLDNAGKTGDLSEFISYAVQGFRDGLLETLQTLQRRQFHTTWRSYIYDLFAKQKYRKTVFKRRRRLAFEFPVEKEISFNDIFMHSPTIARLYSPDEPHTLRRDLEILIEMGIVIRQDNAYRANIGILANDLPTRRESIR